jgi:hypothetical protein
VTALLKAAQVRWPTPGLRARQQAPVTTTTPGRQAPQPALATTTPALRAQVATAHTPAAAARRRKPDRADAQTKLGAAASVAVDFNSRHLRAEDFRFHSRAQADAAFHFRRLQAEGFRSRSLAQADAAFHSRRLRATGFHLLAPEQAVVAVPVAAPELLATSVGCAAEV